MYATKADLKHLAKWLARKRRTRLYLQNHGICCMLAQYLRDNGFAKTVFVVGENKVHNLDLRCGFDIPDDIAWIANSAPHTFGAALKRTKQAIKDRA